MKNKAGQDLMTAKQNTGVISYIHRRAGYGFIEADGTAEILFFHFSRLKNIAFDQLNSGQRVAFDMGTRDRGPYAKCVCVLKPEPEEVTQPTDQQ